MALPEISIEQNNIIQQLLLNNNIVVDSVAGSGKTTCNLHIAKYFNNMNILLLTYNSKLRLETREKAKKLGICNIEVHSYHSFCVKYYDNQCFTDTIINKIIKNKKKPLNNFKFDLIVPDEAQDITSLYYELICKIYKDNKNIKTKICVFGDKKQSIFDFNNADQRFIEYAPELFNFNSYNWIRCNLPISFRITYEMSLFINKCLLKEDHIISNKITKNKPRYIICDCFGNNSREYLRTFEEVKYYFDLGYKPNDIFILAPSIKGNKSPVKKLENKIKREMENVMIYVPSSDDAKIDQELLEGKLVFSTFHQAKGLERKVVIIFNFDNSYFEFYKKDCNSYICSNELYVATTRGIDHLTLFHHNSNEYFHFINKTNIQLYCHFEAPKAFLIVKPEKPITISTSITDIIKFLPQNIIDECFNQLEITQIRKYIINKINIPLKISNGETTECVSEITGIAIPSMFELKLKNKMNILELLIENDFEKNVINNGNNVGLTQLHNKPKHKMRNINDINLQNLTPAELLYISNCWNTYKNGYLFKIYQITNYEWLEEKKLNECINRLTQLNISINSLFEYKLETANEVELLNRKLVGFIDCIDKENNIVYEFKCVQKLEKEHYLQLALYMYMYELEKIKHIKRITDEFNKNNDILVNKSIMDLLHIKDHIIKKIAINDKNVLNYKNNIIYDEISQYSVGDIITYKLFNVEIDTIVKIYKTNGKIKVKNGDYKNNIIYDETSQYSIGDIIKYKLFNEEIGTIVKIYKKNGKIKVKNFDNTNNIIYDKTSQYSVGDIIKYKLFNEEIGTILKIYKTNGKIKVKNCDKKNIDILKTLILSIKKHLDIDDIKTKINDIENDLCKLNNELTDINKLINELKQQELIRLTNKLDFDIKLYNRETEYVLFNILTNEYINIKCEFKKLRKMIEYLTHSKYIKCKSLTTADFIKINKNIYKLYFA